MGTIGKYINVPNSDKFNEEEQNGKHCLRRDTAQAKPVPLYLKYWQLNTVGTQKFWDEKHALLETSRPACRTARCT